MSCKTLNNLTDHQMPNAADCAQLILAGVHQQCSTTSPQPHQIPKAMVVPSLAELKGGSQQVVPKFYPPLNRAEYRTLLRECFDDSMAVKFEHRIEPHLHHKSDRMGYLHCLTVVKALRMMMRTTLDREGRLQWVKKGFFTPEESLMTGREELLRMCQKVKPSFTLGQLRVAMQLLKRYGILWVTKGRAPSYHPFKTATKGSIMFVRFNVKRFHDMLNGRCEIREVSLTQKPVAKKFGQKLNGTKMPQTSKEEPAVRSTVPVRHSPGNQVVSAPDRQAVPSEEKNQWADGLRPSPTIHFKETGGVYVPKDEADIVKVLTSSPHMFRDMDGTKGQTWDKHCVNENLLNLRQLKQIHHLVQRKILTKQFCLDYAALVCSWDGHTDDEGNRLWWSDVSIDYFLAHCARIKRETYRAFNEMELDHESFEFDPVQMIYDELDRRIVRTDGPLEMEQIAELGIKLLKFPKCPSGIRGIVAALQYDDFFRVLGHQGMNMIRFLDREKVMDLMTKNPRLGDWLVQHSTHLREMFGLSYDFVLKIHRDGRQEETDIATADLYQDKILFETSHR